MAWFRSKEATRTHIKQLRHLDLPSSKLSPTINYNNIIYAVAGEAAANVAGMSYRELIRVKLFEPLGFKNAGLSQLEMAKQPDFAMPYDAATFEDAKNGIHEEGYIDEIPMADAPAGDIYMNVVDLAKWGRVILKEGELDGKQVLNKESIQETLKPHNIVYLPQRRHDFGPTMGYGLGWMLDSYKGRTIIQHGTCFLFSFTPPPSFHEISKTNQKMELTRGFFLYTSVRWMQRWLQVEFGVLPR